MTAAFKPRPRARMPTARTGTPGCRTSERAAGRMWCASDSSIDMSRPGPVYPLRPRTYPGGLAGRLRRKWKTEPAEAPNATVGVPRRSLLERKGLGGASERTNEALVALGPPVGPAVREEAGRNAGRRLSTLTPHRRGSVRRHWTLVNGWVGSFRGRATPDREPFKPVAIQFSGQFEQDARIARGSGPIEEQVVLPLFLEASEPLQPPGRDDTDDIGQIARANASGDRQLHRLVELLVFPPLLDPVTGHRPEPLVRPTAATAFA